MVNLVEPYLSRLQSRLAKRLSDAATKDHVREIELHLEESISDQVSRGKTLEAATINALRSVGNDRLVADSLIRAHSGINSRSVWRFAWISAFILLLYGLIPLTFFYLEPIPEWLSTSTFWLPDCFVVVFGYACWRSRKVLLAPMAVTTTILLVATMVEVVAFSPLGYTSISTQTRAHTVARFQQNISDFEHQLAFAKSGANTQSFPAFLRQDHNYMAPKSEVADNQTYYPGLPFPTSDGRSMMLFLYPCASEKAARRLWVQNGAKYALSLEYSIRSSKSDQVHWANTKMDSKEFGNFVLRSIEIYGSILFAIISLNLLVLGLGAMHRKAVEKLWRPERLA